SAPQLDRLIPFGPTTRTVAVSGDGRLLAVDRGETIAFIDTASGREMRSPLAVEAAVTAIALSTDGRLLATGDSRGRVTVLGVETGKPVGTTLSGIHDRVLSLVFSPDDSKVASVSGQQPVLVTVWNRTDSAPLLSAKRKAGFVSPPVFSPDGRTLA